MPAIRSARALLIVDRLHGQSAWRAQNPNIPPWWLAEEAAIFAVELAGALVSHLERRTGRVQTIHQHPFSRCMQPKLLLILQRTHGGQRPKMMVQRRDTHARDSCELLHPQRLRVVRPHPGDGLRRPVALISQRGNRSQSRALRSPQDSVDDLALNQSAQKRNVLRDVQQIDEPAARIEQFRCRLTGRHSRSFRRRLSRLNLLSAQKLSDYGHFEFQHETEIRHRLTCLDHIADHWQVERRQQVSRLIEDEGSSAEVCLLPPLRNHGQARLVGRRDWRRRGGSPAQQQARNVGDQSLFAPNEKGNLPGQLGAQFSRSAR